MAISDFMLGGQSAGSGWARAGSALGQAMSGGGAQGVYDETMLRGHRVQKALKDAQKATLEYQSMMDLEEKLSETFGPELARAAAATSNAGGNFSQLAQGRHWMLRGDGLSDALAGSRQGASLADITPSLAVSGGDPVQLTKVEGNTIISPYEAMTSQTPQLTPYAAGRLGNDAARVAGQNAAAMVRATAPRATGGRAGEDAAARKEYDRIKKEAAQKILTEAKLAGRDVYGLSLADIMAQMDGGEVRDMEGQVIGRWDVDFDTFANPGPAQAAAPAPSAAMAGGTRPATGVSTAPPGAPVTRPQQRATATSPMDGVLGPSIADIVLDGAPGPASGGTMAVARPSSKAEYDALPSGTRFIAPDGTERIKP